MQLFMRVKSRALVPIPIYSSPELVKYHELLVDSSNSSSINSNSIGSVAVNTPSKLITQLGIVFECKGTNAKNPTNTNANATASAITNHQFHSFEALLSSIDSITHLYPGIPKDSLFV